MKMIVIWFIQLKNWIPRLFSWIILDAKDLWITSLVIAAVVGSSYLTFGIEERGFRVSGLFLELLGILVVAKGLSDSRQLFERPSMNQSLLNWLKQFPKFGGNNYVLVAGEGRFKMENDSVAAFGLVGKAPHTIEGRIALLEKRLDLADKQIQEGNRKIEDETKNRVEAMNSEVESRNEGDLAVRKQLEEAVVGGILLEIKGIVWLATGVILSTLSTELDGISRYMMGA